MNDNQSKFEQPIYQSSEKINLPDYYAFFPCQIPHDETIKFHSDVTVEEALERTCIATQEIGMNLVVKGHPVNPGSMQSLKEIAKKYLHVTWYDDVSIHQLIQTARCTVTVNSGVGFESLLHKIPVVTFGRSEYDCVTYKVNSNTDLGKTIKQASHSVFNYEEVCDFYNSWWKYCYDSKNGDDFTKLPS
jgi:capsule polysaccharide modification protein KpsS